MHPVCGSHPSSVHASPSTHVSGVPLWHAPVPVSHVSRPSHTLWLPHCALVLQHPGIAAFTHMLLPLSQTAMRCMPLAIDGGASI